MINPHEIYTFKLAKEFQKGLANKIFLSDNGELCLIPTKFCIYDDNKINFDNLGKFNQSSVSSLPPDKVTTFKEINDGTMFFFMEKYIERVFKNTFKKNNDDNIGHVKNFVSANIIKQYRLPIINIDNKELIQMINDTDLKVKFENDDVRLPFDSFLLRFTLNARIIELFVKKVVMQLDGAESAQTLIFAEGISINYNGSYMQVCIPITGYVELIETDLSIEEKLIQNTIVNFVQKLLYYFTLEKSVEYIDKTKQKSLLITKPKSLKEQKYGVTIINLFKDIRYNYKVDNNDTGGTKNAHLVRGHFRKQPVGSRNDPEFKVIWIQPYFTGSNLPTGNKRYYLQP